MKIVISNTVALNGGDAAILQAIMGALRGEFGDDTRFVVFDTQPEIARKYYPDIDFRKLLYWRAGWSPDGLGPLVRPMNLGRFELATKLRTRGMKKTGAALLSRAELADLKEYESADLIVSTGGTYLVENYDFEPRLFDYEIALTVGCPLVFYTQSLGPFRMPSNRTRLRRIFNDARLVLLRDERSRENLLEIGVQPSKLRVSADAVFALDGPPPKPRQASTDEDSSLRVAVSVRHWTHFEGIDAEEGMRRYRDAIAHGVRHLVEDHGARVTFVSTCQGIPEYWTHDSRCA
ncbi:MAG: polysaccharide pyruvyl transferase family protein, partial [Bradymonadaceae bacterium]